MIRPLSWMNLISFVTISNSYPLFVGYDLNTSRFSYMCESLLVYKIIYLCYYLVRSEYRRNNLMNEVKKNIRNYAFGNEGSRFMHQTLHFFYLRQLFQFELFENA